MRKLFEARGECNVFHDYYRKLVWRCMTKA